MLNKIKAKNNGFTLLELIVVAIILGILIATAVPRFMGTVNRTEAAVEDAVLDVLLANAESYSMETFIETGRKLYPHNPFLGATIDGYVGSCCDAQESGQWGFNGEAIIHVRNDDSVWEWSYSSQDDNGNQADDRGSFGDREAVTNRDDTPNN